MLRFRTLGGLSIENAVSIGGSTAHRRPLALLALLAVEGRRGLSRDKIVALLWPESDSEHGRNSLSQVISLLRRELEVDDVVLGTAELRVNTDVLACDVIEFEQRIAADDLEAAIALYTGPFLDGVFLKNTPEFERWVDQERSRLEHVQGDALERVATRATVAGDHVSAVRFWRQRARLAPNDSRAALKLMESMVASGDPAGALEHYRVHHTLLRDDLGLEPDTTHAEFAAAVRGGISRPADAPTSASRKIAASSRAKPAQLEGLNATAARRINVPRKPARAAAVVSALIVIGATAAIMIGSRLKKAPVALAAETTRLTFDGNVRLAAISPDGSLLAYVAGSDTTPTRLMVRDLTGGSSITLGTVGSAISHPETHLKWSPDGSELLFSGLDSAERLVTVIYPRLGGTPRPSPCGFGNSAWSTDGARLACWTTPANSRVRFVDLATLDTSSIPPPDALSYLLDGDWSPDGKHFALATAVDGQPRRFEIWNVRRGDSSWQRLAKDSVVAPSDLAWSRDGNAIYYFKYDEWHKIGVRSSGAARGEPEVIQTGLGNLSYTFTADRSALAYTKSQGYANVWSATEVGRGGSGRVTWTALTQNTSYKTDPALSPDGAWVAFYEGPPGDIVVIPFGGGAPRRISSSARPRSAPAWSPDGTQLAFGTLVHDTLRMRVVGRDGEAGRTYEKTEVGAGPPIWAPGARILYPRPGNRNYHFLDPRTGDEVPLVSNDSVGWMSAAFVVA